MIQWTSRLETGVPLQDRQHRQLVNKANELSEAMKQGKGREIVGEIITFLGKYAVQHFDAEEGLMRKAGYPKLAEHHQIHEDFKQTFTELAAAYDKDPGRLSLTLEVQDQVLDWLRDHIAGIDQEVGAFIKDKGVG